MKTLIENSSICKWGGVQNKICITIFTVLVINTMCFINISTAHGAERYSSEQVRYGMESPNATISLGHYNATPNTIELINPTLRITERSYSGSTYYYLYYMNNIRLILNGQNLFEPTSYTNVKFPRYDFEDKYIYLNSKVVTGLIPNSRYYVYTWGVGGYTGNIVPYCDYYIRKDSGGVTDHQENNATGYGYNEGYRSIFTEIAKPIINFKDIKDTKLTVQWNPMNNPSYTKYTLQRRIGLEAWTTIVSNTTTLSYTDTTLIPETEYQYRLLVTHVLNQDYSYDSSRDIYSDVKHITTTSDPAIAAAQEAASQSLAAKEAAEQTLQYSIDAKNAAINAESKASEAVELIKGLKTEFNATIAPFIKSVKGINNATATKDDHFTVLVSALNATQYRAGVNGSYTAWQSSPQIDVPLPTVGVNTIEVQARRSDAQDTPIANDYITVIRLN